MTYLNSICRVSVCHVLYWPQRLPFSHTVFTTSLFSWSTRTCTRNTVYCEYEFVQPSRSVCNVQWAIRYNWTHWYTTVLNKTYSECILVVCVANQQNTHWANLLEFNRLEGYGQTIGGVTHDFIKLWISALINCPSDALYEIGIIKDLHNGTA